MDATSTKAASSSDAAEISIDTPAALAAFIRGMAEELERESGGWENATLPRYLEALGRWAEDMDGYYLGRGEAVPKRPTWATVADMLRAATMYE